MEFIITESQLQKILTEEERSRLGDYMKQLNSFTKNIVNRVHKAYGLNLRMLTTWSTSVAGLMLPLDLWLKTGNFDITEDQRMLLLAGVAATIFFESKRPMVKLFKEIKNEGLSDIFDSAVSKGSELKNSFKEFMNSINVSVGSFLDIVSYSFLIPIITDIHYLATNSTDVKQTAIMIAQRLAASGVVLIGGQVLNSALIKIINRIK